MEAWYETNTAVHRYEFSINNIFLGNPLFYEVDSRCWAVGIQILNAYYHGNLTQDEIKFYGKTVYRQRYFAF